MLWLATALMLALGTQGRPPNVSNPATQGDLRLWFESYEIGVNEFKKQDWSAAIKDLEAARQKRSQPGRAVITTGKSTVDYFPDYYLGIAYFNLKQYAQSNDAFNRIRIPMMLFAP